MEDELCMTVFDEFAAKVVGNMILLCVSLDVPVLSKHVKRGNCGDVLTN